MKIRNGFVSNSSSTSFCIFGACIDVENGEECAYEWIESVLEKANEKSDTKLTFEFPIESYDHDEVFVGVSPNNIGEDETFAQFRERIKQAIKQGLDIGTNPAYHTDGGRDC